MSYTEICEGPLKCSDYNKCVKQYEKTGKDKCIKKEAFKTYACNGDNCKTCNHKQECTLHLRYSPNLQKLQETIGDTKRLINETTDPNRKYELQEELRLLRQEEYKKLKILRKRSNICKS